MPLLRLTGRLSIAFALGLVMTGLCGAEVRKPLGQIAEQARPAVDALRGLGADPSAEKLENAEHVLSALYDAASALIAKRDQSASATAVRAIFTDENRLAGAITDYQKRGASEAAGILALGPGERRDIAFIFAIGNILLKHGRRDLVEKVRQLTRSELHEIIRSLTSGKPRRHPSDVEKELREFIGEVVGPRQVDQETYEGELDEAIDFFCSLVRGWRGSAPVKRLPSLAGISLLACRARLAQDRDEQAEAEYAEHAALLYKVLAAEMAAERLLGEAYEMKSRLRYATARHIFLLVRGEPSKDAGTYLSRVNAALCLTLEGQASSVALAELSKFYRDDYSDAKVAAVLFQLAICAQREQEEFALRILKRIMPDLSRADVPQARYLVCAALISLGQNDEAVTNFKILQKEFPGDRYTRYAGDLLKKCDLLPADAE